ncbi:non-ribosomal peptide synthetase [Tahibacter sp.]|uniref:non-ribosomal peptide synthetase n=1 Tax=Tahibacter sp. TaxID=2056211 RepID=UPI0028C3E9EF|nr:non-ribosomal peptide synthetase [Tahibacter sp.]
MRGPRLVRAASPLHRSPGGISAAALAAFEHLCRSDDADVFAGLHAAFVLLLARCSGERDIAVCTPIIGTAVNWILHSDLARAPTFRSLLAQSRDTVRDAQTRSSVRFAGVEALSQPGSDDRHTLLFQLDLVQREIRQTGGGADIVGDFALCASRTADGLSLEWVYASDLLEASTIARMARRLEVLIDAATADPDGDPWRLPLLDAAERQQVLYGFNDTAAPFRSRTLNELFAEQVARTPDAIALVSRDAQLSFAELDRRANRLAHYLRAQGVRAQSLVAVCLERSSYLVVGLLAIHKAGGAYVPLDPQYPSERLDFMVADSGAAWVLAQSGTLAHLNAHAARITLDDPDFQRLVMSFPDEAPPPLPGHAADALAYIIYTSGSTGRPKGVCIEHRQAAALIGWAQSVYDADALSGVLAATSICFDLSVFELFVPLCSGGRIVLVENPLDFEGIANAPELRLINTVPSAVKALLEENAIPSSVRIVNLAGEPLPEALVKEIYLRTPAEAVYNLYGPSEDTTYSTVALIGRDKPGAPSIGKAVSNGQVYVLDRFLEPAPVGVVGEVYCGGAGVTRGYWNRPDLTAERFIADPFLDVPGARLYRTGDLARWTEEGELEFLGRADFQVKVRGLRIELGEIQARLLDMDLLEEAVVTVRDDGRGDKQLLAYVVPFDATMPQSELFSACRSHLAEQLPDYMIPSVFVALKALPLTPNGKIDRAALPPPPENPAPDYVAPESDLDVRLARLWQDVLQLPTAVSMKANFFDLGGHSILAMRLLGRVRQELDIVVHPKNLFSGATLEDFSRLVAQGGERAPPPLRRATDRVDVPVSFVQQGIWLIDELDGSTAQYHVQLRFLLEGELDLRALRGAIDAVVRRHESLRTVVVLRDEQPELRVLDTVDVPFLEIDLCGQSRAAQAAEMERIVRGDALAPFALDRDSMLRATLVRVEVSRYELLLTTHHIATDGWSLDVFVAELGAQYGAQLGGHEAALPPLPLEYTDFAIWQRAWLKSEVLEEESRYWMRQLADLPLVHQLPLDRPRGAQQDLAGAVLRTRVPAAVMRALKDLCRDERATLYMGLHAAFSVLMSRYSGEEDIVVGSPVANRAQPELATLIGLFTNTVVLRSRVSEASTFLDLLRQSRQVVLDAYAHQHVPFNYVVQRLQPERVLSHTPLFQVMLSLQDTGRTPLDLPGVAVTARPMHVELALVELMLEVTENADGLQLDWIYRRELFDASTIERMARHFDNLVRAAVAQPGRDVRKLPLLDPAERGPLDDVRAYVLNDELEPQPAGVTGELHIAAMHGHPGAGPSSDDHYVRDPFSTDPAARLYRTGNLVRRLANGSLEFVGRRDGGSAPRATRAEQVETTSGDTTARRATAAPQTAAEKVLHEIWARLLQQDTVDIDLNFFAAGGNSLLMMRMIHGVRERIGARINIKDVFQHPTIRRLATALDGRTDVDDRLPNRLREGHESNKSALSLSQFRIWYVEQIRASNEHNIPFTVALRGTIDAALLERALNGIVARHDMLRTGFLLDGDAPVQLTHSSLALALEYRDLAALPPADIATTAQVLAVGHATRRFDIRRPPLIAAMLIRVAAAEYRLHLNFHHLIFDGWSFAIFFDELIAAYEALVGGTEPDLPALSHGYLDFVRWQRRWLQSEEAQAQAAFWRDYLQGCPEHLTLARKGAWPVDDDDAPSRVSARLDAATRERLLQLARDRQGTSFSVLYSAFALLLGRLAGQHDLAIGIPVSGRHVRAAHGVIGNFLNNVPVRSRWQPQQAFGDYLAGEIRNLEQVLSNQDYPFEKILELAPHMRNTDTTPVFQVFFNMPSLPRSADPKRFDAALEASTEIEPKFDLTMYVQDDGAGITLTCHYKRETFSSAAVAHLLQQYVFLLEQVATDAQQPCGAYSLRPDTPEEGGGYPEPQRYWLGPVHEIFRRHALERPHATAIVEHAQQWSYGELLAASSALAQSLRQEGVGQGHVVAIVAARRACLVVGVMAALQTGAAFSLLDPEYPVERVCLLVDIIKPACVLFAGERSLFPSTLSGRLEAAAVCRYLPVAKDAHDTSGHEGFVPASVEPQQLACVTFTSGTTGVPKAVAGTHIGIAGYLAWVPDWLQLSQEDRFSLLSGLGHDPLQRDMFTSLCIGATLVVPEPEVIVPQRLAQWLTHNAITFVHLTPAMAEILCTTDATRFPSLRVAFVTGDKLGDATVAKLRGFNSALRVLNSYGTTETQRGTTYFEASGARHQSGLVPAGEASPDTVIRVLNAMGTPCGLSEVGDLFVESHALSRGYLNDAQLTAEVFSELGDGLRRYRTGDVGCRLPDGTILLLGRKDNQVKVRGFRVEIGEIEAHARSLGAVRDAAVVPVRRQGDESALVAYVVPAGGTDDERSLRAEVLAHLGASLPPYMVPAAVVVLSRLPLTPNGKLDRRALPEPAWDDAVGSVAPRDDLEAAVASIWAQVLGLERVGVEDNFFALGGHSMLMVLLLVRIQERFGSDTDVGRILSCSTVAEQARVLSESGA